MSAQCDGNKATLLEDVAFRFVTSLTGPVYTYPANGLPTVDKPAKTIETTFLTAARRDH